MRLIDADAFIEDLKKQMETATNPFFAMSCDFCIFHLEEQPTAYDVEAVVTKLKENALTKFDWSEAIDLDDAISIVRGKE